MAVGRPALTDELIKVMSPDTLLALILFALLLVGTPGPANILAMAAGAKWGLRLCIPFIAGLTCGKLLLNATMGVGLLTLLSAQPLLADLLRVVSGGYLLYLAWRITRIRLSGEADDSALMRPGFIAGLIVHPLNPKAWAMSTSAYAQFADAQADWLLQCLIIMLTFFAVQSVMHPLWCLSGQKLSERIGGTVWEQRLLWTLAGSVVLLVLWTMLTG